MTDTYLTITPEGGKGTYSEKRSKFLAFAHYVESEDEVKILLDDYRKKYYDARHICYAYTLGADRSTYRANDDGEPCNSAGKPILGQIDSRQLTDVLVVVVRYYGGINLGVGGLIVAYRTAASAALEQCETVVKQVEEQVRLSFEYPLLNDVMRIIKDMRPHIVSQSFDNTCNIIVSVRQSEAETLRNRFNKLLAIANKSQAQPEDK